MNSLDRLQEYLATLERRLRVLALSRGAAVTAAVALGATLAAVVAANRFAFSAPSVLASRVLLFLALAAALAAALIVPLVRLNRRRAAREAERKCPEFNQRLLTFTERLEQNPQDPFLPLLADDSLDAASRAEPERVAGGWRMAAFPALAAGCLAVLAWLGIAGPGFLGYGTSLLWGGVPRGGDTPFYDVVVEPGDRTVRRRSDQFVTARLIGFHADRVRLLVRYAGASKWEETDMRPQPESAGWEFMLAGVPESLEYYVEAGNLRSKTYRFQVVDLPVVKRLRVAYQYPAWTGMPPAVEDPGGDLRAVEGTVAEVTVETDRPLSNGALVLDDGRRIPLRDGAAKVPIEKDGLYHVAAIEQGEEVRLSDDYFIESQLDRKPAVRIARPGRDARVTPIEEVTVAVEAADDFGLRELTLHYSVNGGPEKRVPLLGKGAAASAEGSTTLYLEDYNLQPGDIVSFYATARDARESAGTDIYFIEAQPYERVFRQSQQMGGGGGGEGGEQQGEISQRQKEIIAATWNQIRARASGEAAAENARFLAGVQEKLRDQARSLVNRMRSRQIAGANDAFRSFAEDMDKAIEAMGPAAEKLKSAQWQPALAPEQKALQHLLRAEATFRDIQVAFGQRGGGGGGAAGSLGRDLEGLFDLELDTEKNQYETGQQSASGRQREIDEALQKLERLARRQQELAERSRNPQQAPQQRWEQEMLRREAEQLQRQMEQAQAGGQQGQTRAGQQGQMRAGQSGAQSQEVERAMERLQQALRDMRQAASAQAGGAAQGAAEARRAAERLQEARDLLSGVRRDEAGRSMDDLVRRGEDMARRQQDFSDRLRRGFGLREQPAQGDPGAAEKREEAQRLAAEKQRMIEDVQRLESDMQQTARDMAGSQRQAAGKLREALGNLQQEEVAARMRWSAEAIRRGLAPYAAMREALTTHALNNLADQLREAREAVGAGGNQPGDRQGIERALRQAEGARRRMEGALGAGANTGAWSAMNRGDRVPPPGGRETAPVTTEDLARALDQGVRDLNRLRQELDGAPDISQDVQQLIREMERLDPKRFPGNPRLLTALHSRVLAEFEQIELRLRRLADEDRTENVRSAAEQPVAPGYAEAVAEYYRKLSRNP